MLKNIINVSVGYFFRYAFQLIAFFYLAKSLGASIFGEFSTIYSIAICLASISAWGGYPLIARDIANKVSVSETYSTSLFLTALITLPLLFLCILINKIFYINISIFAFLLVIISESFFTNALQLSSSVFISNSFFKHATFLQIFSGISRFLFSLLLYFLADNFKKDNILIVWSILYFINSVIIWILSYYCIFKKFGRLAISRKCLLSHCKHGGIFTLSSLAEALYTNIDKVILSFFLSYSSIGIYSTAYRFVFVAYMPINAILTVTYKRFFELGKESFELTRNFAFKTLRITILYSIFAFLSLYFISFFIEIFLGDSFSGTSFVLKIMSFSLVIQGVYAPFIDCIIGVGKEKIVTLIKTVSLLINVVLNIFLLEKYNLIGAVISFLLSHVFICLIIFYIPSDFNKYKDKINA